jgi:hypothetical protein
MGRRSMAVFRKSELARPRKPIIKAQLVYQSSPEKFMRGCTRAGNG